eukprot:6194075-Pleurochrysis_carterae.AAC.3
MVFLFAVRRPVLQLMRAFFKIGHAWQTASLFPFSFSAACAILLSAHLADLRHGVIPARCHSGTMPFAAAITRKQR